MELPEPTPLNPVKKEKSELELRQTNAWQRKLMPWLILMPTMLILLFVYLATRQMQRFNTVLETKSESAIEKLIPAPSDTVLYNKLKGDMEYIRWVTLARMEEKSFDRRYNQSGLLLASRIFTKYLGFFTGMIMAIVGSVFIIGKLQEERSDIEGGAENMKVKLASSSPGIIFGVLGTILMLSTILQHTDITTNDKPLFLTQPNVLLNTGMNKTPAPAAGEAEKETISAAALDSLFNNQ